MRQRHKAASAPSKARNVGLARALSKLGICSRSQAATWIRAGRVQLNGKVRRDPETPVHLGCDRIEVDGEAASPAEPIYLMLNKPRGVLTTASDNRGRSTVYDFLPREHAWVGPVGRLDQASEGLLLLTNDSEWGAALTDPGSHINKVYHVQIDQIADERVIRRLEQGVRDGSDLLRVKRASLLRAGQKNSWLEIVLEEGKNRHIRRMLTAQGIGVLRLIRVAIGRVVLGDLAKGAYRSLTAEEVRSLAAARERV